MKEYTEIRTLMHCQGKFFKNHRYIQRRKCSILLNCFNLLNRYMYHNVDFKKITRKPEPF